MTYITNQTVSAQAQPPRDLKKDIIYLIKTKIRPEFPAEAKEMLLICKKSYPVELSFCGTGSFEPNGNHIKAQKAGNRQFRLVYTLQGVTEYDKTQSKQVYKEFTRTFVQL